MGKVDDAIAELLRGEAATSCHDLVATLEGLEFKCKRRSRGNHWTFVHPGLAAFLGSDFNGGHDKHMNRFYVREVRKLLERYRTELIDLLEVKK